MSRDDLFKLLVAISLVIAGANTIVTAIRLSELEKKVNRIERGVGK